MRKYDLEDVEICGNTVGGRRGCRYDHSIMCFE